MNNTSLRRSGGGAAAVTIGLAGMDERRERDDGRRELKSSDAKQAV